MPVSLLRFGGVGLLVLLMVFGLGTSCGDEKPKAKFVSLTCDPNTKVDVDGTTGVIPTDIYACDNTTVTWVAHGHKFIVYFKNHKCPFKGGCKDIDQDHPTSNPVEKQAHLTVFDYGILVDSESFDPHVVAGGG